MDLDRKKLDTGNTCADIYAPGDGDACPVIYVISGEEGSPLLPGLVDARFAMVDVRCADWDALLTPWPAPGMRRGTVFGGRADEFLDDIVTDVIPAAERTLGFAPSKRGIAGYSLAGLFALHALYKTDAFSLMASVSGSMWYDGLMDFMRAERPRSVPEKAYFSVGDRERITKNPRLAQVEACTREAESLMRGFGAATVFELNAGGHFNDPDARLAKGIGWLLGRCPEAKA